MYWSPGLITVAVYGMTIMGNEINPHFTTTGIVGVILGLCGITYVSTISEESFSLTAAKLLVLTALWLVMVFGLTLVAFTIFKDNPWLYGSFSLGCGLALLGLLKLQQILAGADA